MTDILTQLTPASWTAVILLIALSFLGTVILRLIRAGKAKSPADLIKVARDRAATAKAGKEAVKQAAAASAEPISTSRLSRIGARSEYVEPEEAGRGSMAIMADPPTASAAEDTPVADVAADLFASDADAADAIDAADAADAADAVVPHADAIDAADAADAFVPAHDADAVVPDADAIDAADAFVPAHDADAPVTTKANFDFSDPANHPQNWDELAAVIDVLDRALARPWAEDRLILQLSKDQLAAGAAGDEAATLALSRQLAATDLARTINSAAREQATEVVAIVREFAHQGEFSADECAAVMGGLSEIQWMALVARGDVLEKRTLPLTASDAAAPLWVEDAQAAVARLRQDIAA